MFQSRCAILRYSKLSDAQILKRLIEVCEAENVTYTKDGLQVSSINRCCVKGVLKRPVDIQALLFTADGDMRNALNNLQSTAAGFGVVNENNVYRVGCKLKCSCIEMYHCVLS